MIFGIGVDICEVGRFASMDARLPEKILTPVEMQQWHERSAHHRPRGDRFIATRFAAKEALSKALGLGMRAPMAWQHCAVVHNDLGQPVWQLYGPLLDWCQARELALHLSLSDEEHYAIAYCMAEYAPVVRSEGG